MITYIKLLTSRKRNIVGCLFALNLFAAPAFAAGEYIPVPKQTWSWASLTGTFDRASLQRGLQVYKEVCSACHGMSLINFRNLSELGYNSDEIKAFAKEFTIIDGPNADAEMFEREGLPIDAIPSPYVNEAAAREANGGAYPLDLSLIVKARATGRHNMLANFTEAMAGGGAASGADYLYALLTGYEDAPNGFDVGDGMYYNKYYPGHQIAMPMPLIEDGVEYASMNGQSVKASIQQQAYDVTNFLSWASQRDLEHRHQMGIKVVLFLLIFAIVLYFVKKRIWARVKH